MLKVAGHKILVKHMKFKERMDVHVPEALKNTGFEIALSKEQDQREEVASDVGTVVGIGPTAWHAFDKESVDWTPWCKLGDQILYARYSGKLVEDPVTNERFMIINDEDVQAVVEGFKDPFEGE